MKVRMYKGMKIVRFKGMKVRMYKGMKIVKNRV